MKWLQTQIAIAIDPRPYWLWERRRNEFSFFTGAPLARRSHRDLLRHSRRSLEISMPTELQLPEYLNLSDEGWQVVLTANPRLFALHNAHRQASFVYRELCHWRNLKTMVSKYPAKAMSILQSAAAYRTCTKIRLMRLSVTYGYVLATLESRYERLLRDYQSTWVASSAAIAEYVEATIIASVPKPPTIEQLQQEKTEQEERYKQLLKELQEREEQRRKELFSNVRQFDAQNLHRYQALLERKAAKKEIAVRLSLIHI